MTIREVLKKHHQIDETELFLSHLLKMSKTQLIANSTKALTKPQIRKLEQMLKLFKKGMPAAYILGYKYFYGLKFRVNRNTLIPRPESEWLVDYVLHWQKLHKKSKIRVLDIGTGSGCIAIAIAKHAKQKTNITGSDISAKALSTARVNAKANHCKVTFTRSDLLAKIKGHYDVMIANLPYVPKKDYLKYKNNLQYEPKTALTDNGDGTRLYVRLLEQIIQKNLRPRVIIFEIDPSSKLILAKTIKQFFPKHQYPNRELHFYSDLKHLTRYLVLEI